MKALTTLRRSLILIPLVCYFLSQYSAEAQGQPIPTAIANGRTVAIVAHVTSGGRTPAASDLRAETQLKDEACLLLRESEYLAYEADPRRADLVLLLLGGKWKERTGGVIGMVFPGGLATRLNPPLWVAQSARRKRGAHADEIIEALERLVAQSRLQHAPYGDDLASLGQQDPGPLAAERLPHQPKSDFPAALITSKTSVALNYFDD